MNKSFLANPATNFEEIISKLAPYGNNAKICLSSVALQYPDRADEIFNFLNEHKIYGADIKNLWLSLAAKDTSKFVKYILFYINNHYSVQELLNLINILRELYPHNTYV